MCSCRVFNHPGGSVDCLFSNTLGDLNFLERTTTKPIGGCMSYGIRWENEVNLVQDFAYLSIHRYAEQKSFLRKCLFLLNLYFTI